MNDLQLDRIHRQERLQKTLSENAKLLLRVIRQELIQRGHVVSSFLDWPRPPLELIVSGTKVPLHIRQHSTGYSMFNQSNRLKVSCDYVSRPSTRSAPPQSSNS